MTVTVNGHTFDTDEVVINTDHGTLEITPDSILAYTDSPSDGSLLQTKMLFED